MAFILSRAANVVSGMATGGAVIVEGNTGMGKTKLLTEVSKYLVPVCDAAFVDEGEGGEGGTCHCVRCATICVSSILRPP